MRRSGDEAAGLKPIHLVSAWALTQRLVLAQEAVSAKANQRAAIMAILDRLPVKSALVTIDAIVTKSTVAAAIATKGGDDVLAPERNRPTLHDEVATSFGDPATTGLPNTEGTDKDHGRIETRTTTVSHGVAWMTGHRRHPGEHRFPTLACLIKTTTQVERHGPP